ncbi:MAG: hypothetical protein AB1775_11215 [Bacteroidota bacterium]
MSPNEMLDEYVMLALRSKGLDLIELENKFGKDWFSRNEKWLKQLVKEKFLIKKEHFLSFTPKGYVIGDEILSNFS